MHEDSVIIKAIGRDETGSIRALWEKLNVHHLSRSTYFKDFFSELTFTRRMEMLDSKVHFIAYVAESNDEYIGYCIATVDGRAGEIDSLYVLPASRGQGVGEALMSNALQWLESHECETIRISIAEGNEGVLSFYRKFNFAERFTVMQKLKK